MRGASIRERSWISETSERSNSVTTIHDYIPTPGEILMEEFLQAARHQPISPGTGYRQAAIGDFRHRAWPSRNHNRNGLAFGESLRDDSGILVEPRSNVPIEDARHVEAARSYRARAVGICQTSNTRELQSMTSIGILRGSHSVKCTLLIRYLIWFKSDRACGRSMLNALSI